MAKSRPAAGASMQRRLPREHAPKTRREGRGQTSAARAAACSSLYPVLRVRYDGARPLRTLHSGAGRGPRTTGAPGVSSRRQAGAEEVAFYPYEMVPLQIKPAENAVGRRVALRVRVGSHALESAHLPIVSAPVTVGGTVRRSDGRCATIVVHQDVPDFVP